MFARCKRVRAVFTVGDSVLKYLTGLVVLILLLVFTSPLIILWERRFSVETVELNLLVESLILSLITSMFSSILVFIFSVPVAFTLTTIRGSFKRTIEAAIMIPVIVSPSAIGSIILLFFAKSPVGSTLNRLIGVLNDPKGVVLAQFTIGFPVAVSFYTALFSSIPRVYEETAMEAGLSRLEYLYRVLLPMTRNHVLSGLVLIYARVFADFGTSLIVGGGIRGKTWTFPIYVYMMTQYGEITVLSVTLLIYILVAFGLLYALYSVREISSGLRQG
jgi:molybdate transport system permease protein